MYALTAFGRKYHLVTEMGILCGCAIVIWAKTPEIPPDYQPCQHCFRRPKEGVKTIWRDGTYKIWGISEAHHATQDPDWLINID